MIYSESIILNVSCIHVLGSLKNYEYRIILQTMNSFMESLHGRTFIITVVIFILVKSHRVHGQYLNLDEGYNIGGKSLTFDSFILGHIDDYKNNVANGSFYPSNFEFFTNSSLGYANGTIFNATMGDIKQFYSSMSSSIGSSNGSFDMDLNFLRLFISGKYHLDGLAQGTGLGIIVHGDGNFSIEIESHWQSLQGVLFINPLTRYSNITSWSWKTQPTFMSISSTFDGILDGDFIGSYIKDYLATVGQHIFRRIEMKYYEDFFPKLKDHLNNILQTVTIDEILGGGSTTTPLITSSTQWNTGVTSKPDLVVDVGSDLDESGWEVPAQTSCTYAASITGFLCQGSPVLIQDPSPRMGFWMSPCPGECTFIYRNIEDARSLTSLSIRNYHNDLDSRLFIGFLHSGGSAQFVLEKSNGTYNRISLSSYSNNYGSKCNNREHWKVEIFHIGYFGAYFLKLAIPKYE